MKGGKQTFAAVTCGKNQYEPFGQLRCLTPNESFWCDTAAGKTFSVLEGF
jgi:hypothetical protein